jgi:hypothetical protein
VDVLGHVGYGLRPSARGRGLAVSRSGRCCAWRRPAA